MIRGQTLPTFENKSRTFAVSAQTIAGIGLSTCLGFINNLSTVFRHRAERHHLRRLTPRQLEDIGLTVAERDGLAGLPRL
jgi:uncharacterized protein YjiS (DUF1127 family)